MGSSESGDKSWHQVTRKSEGGSKGTSVFATAAAVSSGEESEWLLQVGWCCVKPVTVAINVAETNGENKLC